MKSLIQTTNSKNQILQSQPLGVVFITNQLARVFWHATVAEQKALYLIFSQAQSHHEECVFYFEKSEFLKNLDMHHGSRYAVAKDLLYGLVKKSCFVDWDKGRAGVMIRKVDWQEGKSSFKVTLEQDIMPELVSLKSHFTKQQVQYVLNLKGDYALTMYRFLCSWANENGEETRTSMTLQELKQLLGVSEDTFFVSGKFRKSVFERLTLKKVWKQINEKTDLNFDYEWERTQRYNLHISKKNLLDYSQKEDQKTLILEDKSIEQLIDHKTQNTQIFNQNSLSTESPYVEDFCPEPKHIKEDHNLDLQYLLDDEYSEFNAAGINQLKDFKCLHLYDAEIKQYWASIQKVLFSKHACGDGSHCLNDGDHYVIKRSEDKKLVLQKYICQKDKAKRFT